MSASASKLKSTITGVGRVASATKGANIVRDLATNYVIPIEVALM